MRQRLDADKQFRSYFEGETTELPQFYVDRVRRDLGSLWDWLPNGALHHDPNAYLKSEVMPLQTPSNVRDAIQAHHTASTDISGDAASLETA